MRDGEGMMGACIIGEGWVALKSIRNMGVCIQAFKGDGGREEELY